MNNYAYTFIAIAVYLITIAVVYYTLHKRFTDTLTEIETNYRLSLSRACTAFVEAMNAINRALDTEPGPETPTMTEWALSLCRSSHCHYFDGFTCTRSDVVTDGKQCPCDIDGANK